MESFLSRRDEVLDCMDRVVEEERMQRKLGTDVWPL
jgi:hypothetical protein